jgi:hypothetical protein
MSWRPGGPVGATVRTTAVGSGLVAVGAVGRAVVVPRAVELLGLVIGRSAPVRFDRLLLDVLGVVGMVAYLGVVGSVALTVALTAAGHRAGRLPVRWTARSTVRWAVRWAALVAGVCGLGMTVAPVGSYAAGHASTHEHRSDADRSSLTGLPMPELPTAGIGRPDRPVVVVPGDSLWRIAADRLPAAATDVRIAEAVDRWYFGNRAVIGADPDLILPGTRLERPGGLP